MTAPWEKPITTQPPWDKEKGWAPGQEELARGLPTPLVMDTPSNETLIRTWQPLREDRILRARRSPEPEAPPARKYRESAPARRDSETPARRVGAGRYTAMEIHGFYGLIDDGSDGTGRVLIAHVPRYVRGHHLDIRAGDSLPVVHVSGKAGGNLTVLATGRHRYYSPGTKVSTCTVTVPEDEWEALAP